MYQILLTLFPKHSLTAEPAASSKVAPCLGCPEKIDLYHKELRAPLIHSLAKANGMAKREHLFIFKDFTSATKQVNDFFFAQLIDSQGMCSLIRPMA